MLYRTNDIRSITLKLIHDDRGSLMPMEAQREVPFTIQRIFTVTPGRAGQNRGGHAHRECKQLILCLNGQCKLRCYDGRREVIFELAQPEVAIYVPPTIWVDQEYLTEDTIVMVVCDSLYDEADYIRDDAEFTRFRGTSDQASQTWGTK